MHSSAATEGVRSKRCLHDLATSLAILHESHRKAVGVEVDDQGAVRPLLVLR
jgi:hypothetical protein